ncbi:MAG TPA: carbohydrate ABC transporter permease [Gaiellaceae bacterium]|nr:carbohydrate ABC transporter permease [Gaiellaceae bacterium]
MTTIEAPTVARPTTFFGRLGAFAKRAPIHVALIVIAIIWLIPTIGLAITSFRPRPDIASSGWWTVLAHPHFTLHNYGLVIHATGMGHAWVNSLIITVPATLLPLTLGALAAYAFAWIPFPFRDTIFLVVIILMIIPIQTSLVPLLKLFRDHGHLNNGYAGIWLAHTAFGLPFAIFLFRNFFITLPKDLIEAARMDGGSNFMIFRKVVIPLSVPALAAYAIFQFLWVWNDLLMALIFVSDPAKRPMTVRIPQLLSTYGAEYHLLSAAAFLLMAVPLVVFFSLQRYFVQGLLAGSVKS